MSSNSRDLTLRHAIEQLLTCDLITLRASQQFRNYFSQTVLELAPYQPMAVHVMSCGQIRRIPGENLQKAASDILLDFIVSFRCFQPGLSPVDIRARYNSVCGKLFQNCLP